VPQKIARDITDRKRADEHIATLAREAEHRTKNIHTLFVESRWKGAELSTLARQELAPYLHDNQARAHIDSPQLLLEPNTAQTIAMIFARTGYQRGQVRGSVQDRGSC
jgi:two-component sensor histidine kinase